MSEVIRRLRLMNRKYLILIALTLVVVMVICRILLADVTYLIASGLIGCCGAGMYYSLVKAKKNSDSDGQ